MGEDYRPRLSVDLAALKSNAKALMAMREGAALAPVVKADAYGLGAEKVVRALSEVGVQSYFVAYPEEADPLLPVAGGAIFYILNAAPGTGIYTGRRRPVFYRIEDLQAWDYGACAVQVEIGMHRGGIRPEALTTLEPRDDVELVIAHMSHAGSPGDAANREQRSLFEALRRDLQDVFPKAGFSLSATGGLMQDGEVTEDAVRPGVGLYGGSPGEQGALSPVARFEARVLSVHDVKPGESVGYDGCWTAERPSRIATLCAGYADGVMRHLGNTGFEWAFGGARFPAVGRISMDLTTVDVTDAEGIVPGDWAEFFGKVVPLAEVAEKAGTIGYEVLTAVRGRTQRVYEA